MCAAFAAPAALCASAHPRRHTCTHPPRACATPTPTPPPSLTLDAALAALDRARAARAPAPPASTAPPPPPTVYLVGTGPGDAGLLTLRAAQLLARADVVLYDRLVSAEILALASPHARMVYVGKAAGLHTRTQEEIHALLAAFAGGLPAGAAVVRLKGGDPGVFGRGGEELEHLAARGVPVEVVPGITAASGAAAALRMPLTQRGVADRVTFLTGHVCDARGGGYGRAADVDATLVVYMGLGQMRAVFDELVGGGLPRGTPACAVERATAEDQRTVWGDLASLPGRVEDAGLVSPTLIVVGRVVALAPGYPREERAERVLGERMHAVRGEGQGVGEAGEGVAV